MQDYEFSLTATAGVGQDVPAKGRFIRYDRVTSGATDPDIRINVIGGGGGRFILKPGQSVTLDEEAEKFRVSNVNGTVAIVGLLKIGNGGFNDSSISGEVTVTDARADTLALPGNVTVGTSAVVALAADAARKMAVFTADPANVDVIVLGPSGVDTSTSPIILEAGESWKEEIAAAAAWYARSGTAAQVLRVLEAE